MVYIYCTTFWRRFQSCPKEPTTDSANCICETDDTWDGADTVSCVELPNLRLGNMKGAWTHGAMMTHIRTFVCYFSRLKSLVLPAVGSTNPILRPRIQKPQAMVKHWWNTRGLPPLRTRSDGDRYLWVYKGKTTHLFGCVKKSGKIEGSNFSMHLQRKEFVPDLKGSCKFNPCFSMFFVDITLRAVTAPKWKWCSVSVSAKFANSKQNAFSIHNDKRISGRQALSTETKEICPNTLSPPSWVVFSLNKRENYTLPCNDQQLATGPPTFNPGPFLRGQKFSFIDRFSHAFFKDNFIHLYTQLR